MKKRTKRMNQNGIAMLSITFVVGVLFIAMMTMSLNLQQQISDCKTEMKEVQSQIDEENERTKEIDETKERMDTDEYVAEVAREKLGLVKDNEIVFKEEEKYKTKDGFCLKVFRTGRRFLTKFEYKSIYNTPWIAVAYAGRERDAGMDNCHARNQRTAYITGHGKNYFFRDEEKCGNSGL